MSLFRNRCSRIVRSHVLQYSAPGSEIDITRRDAGDETVICIRDHGPGVPKHLLMQIFEPFYRVDSARRASTGGVGLGLSIVRRIVDLHNGTVAAENTNPGLRVTISLPHAVAAQGEATSRTGGRSGRERNLATQGRLAGC